MKTLKQLLFESGDINQALRLDDLPSSLHGVTSNQKRAIFKMWDRSGHADWDIMKLVGLEINDQAWDNVADIIYPLLKIEWEGGIKETEVYEKAKEWLEYDNYLSYRVIPVGYDFSFGSYSCWNILVELRVNPDSAFGSPTEKSEEGWSWPSMSYEGMVIGEDIFDQKNYPLQTHQNYRDDELELLEEIWLASPLHEHDYFREFCQAAVKIY